MARRTGDIILLYLPITSNIGITDIHTHKMHNIYGRPHYESLDFYIICGLNRSHTMYNRPIFIIAVQLGYDLRGVQA